MGDCDSPAQDENLSQYEYDPYQTVTFTNVVEEEENDWDMNYSNGTAEGSLYTLHNLIPTGAVEEACEQSQPAAAVGGKLSLVPPSQLLEGRSSLRNGTASSTTNSKRMQQKQVKQTPRPHEILPLPPAPYVNIEEPNDSVGAYCCSRCSFSCDDLQVLGDHVTQHQYRETLSCVYCSYKTLSDPHYARHISDHEIERAALAERNPAVVGQSEFEDWDMVRPPVSPSPPPVVAAAAAMAAAADANAVGAVKVEPGTHKRERMKCKRERRSAAKRTDYCEVTPEKSSGNPSSDLTEGMDGKWHCAYCSLKSDSKFKMEKHVNSHSATSKKLAQQKTRERNSARMQVNKSPAGPALSVDHSVESPLSTYISKTQERIIRSDGEDWTPSSSSLRKESPMTCPFCQTISQTTVQHRLHINQCHIQQSASAVRVSSRPSTSIYKVAPIQEKEVFSDLFRSDSHMEFDFEGFENEEMEQPRLPKMTIKRELSPNKRVGNNKYSKTESVGKNVSAENDKQFSCPICSFTHRLRVRFETHLDTVHLDTPVHTCKICTFATTALQDFNTHRNTVHRYVQTKRRNSAGKGSKASAAKKNDGLFRCPLCTFKISNRNNYMDHISAAHEDVPVFTCNRCTFTTTDKRRLKIHYNVHIPVSETMSCLNCYFKSHHVGSFRRHMLMCDVVLTQDGYCKEGSYRCPFCVYRTFEVEFYKEHLLNHVRHEVLTCPLCSFKTSRKDMYRMHLKCEHDIKQYVYRCHICVFKTINLQIYNAHMSAHQREATGVKRVRSLSSPGTAVTAAKRRATVDPRQSSNGSMASDEECIQDRQRNSGTYNGIVQQATIPTSSRAKSVKSVPTSPPATKKPSKRGRKKKEHKYNLPVTKKRATPRNTSPVESYSEPVRVPSPPPAIEAFTGLVPKEEQQFEDESNEEFICPFCCQAFENEKHLIEHVLIHADDGKITCPLCNFSTREFAALKMHLKKLHREIYF